MASEVGRDQGKSAFVRDVLTKDRQANTEAVNRAWTKAGHGGRSARVWWARSAPDGPDGPAAARGQGPGEHRAGRTTGSPSPTATDRSEEGGGAPAKGDGRPVPQVTESEAGPQGAGSQSGGDDRTRVLTRLEGQIDGMLFEIKVAGGLPEFEEALRRTRRILARSYGE